ncbi:MAG: UDP-GlcNAc--UDP-phosphate GlcNAc-1-phosphate transferase, partial [Muribaculaceae bacterium]|nr:UDP-GlcNAc--UDP-phosphate GlcNAc-1-phosphate transferase [Muribaculaceae bacterium]
MEMILTIIFILLVVFELTYFWIACRFNIIDKPELRRSHGTLILRGGGILFPFAVCLFELFFGPEYLWFFLGLLMVGSISFADDMRSLSYGARLVVQFVAVTLLFFQSGILQPGVWWWVVPALIAGVGIVNAFNFMDGINGITGGYSLAVLIPLAILNSKHCFISHELIYVVSMSVLIFSYFNFRKVAKCFAGDVGSISIALILLFALLQLIIKTQDVSYIV